MDVPTLKLLVVEDNPVNALALRKMLAEGPHPTFSTMHVSRLAEGLQSLTRASFDAILLDLALPDESGFNTVARMRAATDLPIIVLTSTDDETLAVKAVQAGAQDYLVKGQINRTMLARAVRYAVERHRTLSRLKDLDRLKSEFLVTASHELRTPLAIVREFVALVHDGVVGEVNAEQQDCLDSALRNCDRLTNLLNELLDLNRIEAGRLKLCRRKTELRPLLEQCYQDFLVHCTAKQQELILEATPDLEPVLCDAEKIRQVIINLVGNANKFTQAGGRIALRAKLAARQVCVTVEDNGKGIAAADQAKVFESFTQLDRQSGPGAQGTGLGLAISRKILQLHEMTLTLDSARGKGSRFSFELPVYDPAAELLAMVEDQMRATRSSGIGATLVLAEINISCPSDHGQSQALEQARTLCASAFAVPADEILVREPESLLALTLEQSVTEAQSGCGRLAGLLREEFGESCSFQCSVLDLTSQQTAGDSVLLAKSNLAPVSLPAARRERKRLLVVDDERAYVDVIKEVLERAHPNFEVETATNGYEACVRYGAFDPDVVIFDIKMPGIDGVQAFKSMRSSRPGSDSKFLVAASESERIQEVMALGCHAYLPKPINYEELVNKVNALLAIPSATTTH